MDATAERVYNALFNAEDGYAHGAFQDLAQLAAHAGRIADALEVLVAEKRHEAREAYREQSAELARWNTQRPVSPEEDEDHEGISEWWINHKRKQHRLEVDRLEAMYPWLKDEEGRQ